LCSNNFPWLYLQNNIIKLTEMDQSSAPKDYLNPGQGGAMPLPNATAVLVLGILSIVICGFLGIIGLVMGNKDISLYKANPGIYSESSYSSLKAGRICSIVGLCLWGFGIIIYAIVIFFVIGMAATQGNI
jgi:hypothetical protein